MIRMRYLEIMPKWKDSRKSARSWSGSKDEATRSIPGSQVSKLIFGYALDCVGIMGAIIQAAGEFMEE